MKETMARVDLNLLRALYVLLEERSVTRAAKRLFITQSAMSKSLLRLRELLDDPLLVRSPQGLLPTTRAMELSVHLRQIFAHVENCLAQPQFDPASAKGRICIAAPEQFAFVTIPELLMRLGEAAPNLSVESQHLMSDYLEMLATGKLDFVVYLDQPYPDGFSATHICTAAPMMWCRKEHPLATKKTIELADIYAYPQITSLAHNVTPVVFRTIERRITNAGLSIRIMLDTSHLLIALDMLGRTDAVLVAPDYLSRLSILQDALVSRPIDHIPAFDPMRINLSLVQHERTLHSPLHRWITGEITQSLSLFLG